MWFKQLQLYRLPAPWAMTPAILEEHLAKQAFVPCTSMELQSQGWVPPRDGGGLVHTVNKQMLLQLRTEKKLLPSSVIKQAAKMRAAEIEEREGFKPGRKRMQEIKEGVTDELLAKAFSLESSTRVWIDPVHGWLVIDSASSTRADDIFRLILRSMEKFPVHAVRANRYPFSCMTEWLANDEAPSGFTIDQDAELRSENNATVRYSRHSLDSEDIAKHIAAGKQCTRLAMTWADKVSFVLTESLVIKQISPLDMLTESAGSPSKDDAERFDSDFLLMAGELDQMLVALIEALGGEMVAPVENADAEEIKQAA